MIRNVTTITASSYLAMFFLGVGVSLVGATARNIGLTPAQIGILLTAQHLGFMVSVSFAGALADTYAKPRILFVGSLILAGGFFTFYLTDLFWLNVVIMSMIGVGIGTYEGVTDALLLDIHTERHSLHINVNHFFVTVGAMLITAYLIVLQMNWRLSIVQAGVAVLLLAGLFAAITVERSRQQAVPIADRFRALTRDRTVAILFLATVVVMGVEIGTTGILTTYLMELRGFTQVTSKIGLIVFFAGMAVGRLGIGALTRRDRLVRQTLALFGLSFVCFTGLFVLDLGVWTYLTIFLSGVAISALLPLLITLAGLLYEEMAGTVIGAIKVAIPVGGMLLPFLMSAATNVTTLQTALLLYPLAFLPALALLAVALRRAPTPTPTGTSEHVV